MLDSKDFSWKGLSKEDKITFIATVVCPIVTFIGYSRFFLYQDSQTVLWLFH